MIQIQFFVQGEPKGQPRPRAFSRGGHARMYDPGTAENWKGQIAMAAKEQNQIPAAPISAPVKLGIVFHFPRPKAHYRKNGELKSAENWHEKKPDVDNCAKAVMDALTQLRFWNDDSQVVEARISKRYVAGRTYSPGAMIEISEAVL